VATVTDGPDGDEVRPRRAYDSPVRRQRAAETHDRILTAGSEIVHELPGWDWRELTFRAVAERAGVGERTVYRHFPTERHLRDAVMERLEEEAGVSYDDVTLGSVAAVATLVFRSLHAFADPEITPPTSDPTFEAVDVRRKAALRRAIADAAPQWSETQQETTAALLDVLWNLPAYERLVTGWQFDGDRASEAITWLIDRVIAAVDADDPPPEPPKRRARRRR
jgi:AcrR family transcriptional regulator